MQVLLREDVGRLGKRGQVVNVAEGYARNYLLPRKLAVIPSEQNLKALEAEHRRAEKKVELERTSLRELAGRLEGTSCTLTAKAGEGGHLFGSVGSAQIAEALRADGFAVTDEMVVLEAPIRELGVYPVELRLDAEVRCATRVWVVAD